MKYVVRYNLLYAVTKTLTPPPHTQWRSNGLLYFYYYTKDEMSSSEQKFNDTQNRNNQKQYDKPFLDMSLVDASEVSAGV